MPGSFWCKQFDNIDDVFVFCIYLVWRPGRNEYDVALALREGVAQDAVLLVQPLPQHVVQVHRLVVDGIGVGLQPLPSLQVSIVFAGARL